MRRSTLPVPLVSEGCPVPTVCRFFGIVVRMYYDDHYPAHFHAFYGGREAVIAVEGSGILQGELPARALGLVIEWARIHESDLMTRWTRARERKELLPIAALE
jgi:hypothetical protein